MANSYTVDSFIWNVSDIATSNLLVPVRRKSSGPAIKSTDLGTTVFQIKLDVQNSAVHYGIFDSSP